MEKAFVKTVAVDGQPAQERIETRQESFGVHGDARQHPTGSHVDHVGVRVAGSLKKFFHAVSPPGREPVPQRQSHRRSFKSEAAKLAIHGFEFGNHHFVARVFQRRRVAENERAAGLFQARPRRRAAAAEAAPLEGNFARRDIE